MGSGARGRARCLELARLEGAGWGVGVLCARACACTVRHPVAELEVGLRLLLYYIIIIFIYI